MNALYSPIQRAIYSAIRHPLDVRRGAVSGPINSATDWYFAALGLAGTPWADVSRTGLGTRVNAQGLIELGMGAGGGPQLVTNGVFASGSSGWTLGAGTVTFATGSASFVNEATNTSSFFQSLSLSAGVPYRIILSGTGQVNYRIDTVATSGPVTLPATIDVSAATIANPRIQIYNVSGSAAVVTGVSVRGPSLAPRITHDPVTLSALGLLVERQATNLAPTSEFPNGVSDAPINGGLLSASTLTGFARALAFGHDGSTTTFAYKSITPTAGAVTFSVFVRMDDGGAPTFNTVNNATTVENSFALLCAGALVNPTTVSVQGPFTGGIYRVRGTGTSSGAAQNYGVVKYGTNSPRTFRVTGYQLETGSVATSYIPNPGTGSAVRVADDWFLSGAALDAALGASRSNFTLFVQWFQPLTSPGFQRILFLGKDDNTRRLIVNTNGSAAEAFINDGTTSGFTSALGSPVVAGAVNRLAISCDGSTFRVVLNGSANGTRASAFGGSASAERLRLLHDAGGNNMNSYVVAARAFPDRAMSIAEMQALTA